MEKRIAELDVVVMKLVSCVHFLLTSVQTFVCKQKQFRKMAAVVDDLEAVLIEAHNVKGWKWVHEQPLWITWSLEKFGTF
jgi:hypothetical protein